MRAEGLRIAAGDEKLQHVCRPPLLRVSWIFANGLSFSRLLVCAPIVVALLRNTPLGDRVAFSLMFWAFASDVADGYIARRTGARSQLGAVLDPVADKVLIGCIVTTLVIVRSLPIWAAGIIILRDIFILVLSAWFIKARGTVLESNYLGKATGLSFAVMIALYTLRIESAGLVMAVFSVGLAIVASLSYLTRFVRLLMGRHQ